MKRVAPGLLMLGALALAPVPTTADGGALTSTLDAAAALKPLETVLIWRNGAPLASRGYRGHGVDQATNIKSASKAIVSALTGVAIGRGHLQGIEQPVAPLVADLLPEQPDPRLDRITIGHLLSMQAGLARTSGRYYGRWIISDHWARAVLARPFVAEPGGAMLYSTGSTHLLSVILSRETGRSTLALARDWLGPLEGFRIDHWQRDPQGYYFGGNQMTMTPRSLLAFGELYRRDGLTAAGQRLLPEGWVERSWQPRTQSRFTGDDYGFGWFMRSIAGLCLGLRRADAARGAGPGHDGGDDLGPHRAVGAHGAPGRSACSAGGDPGRAEHSVQPLVGTSAAGVHSVGHPEDSSPNGMHGRNS